MLIHMCTSRLFEIVDENVQNIIVKTEWLEQIYYKI